MSKNDWTDKLRERLADYQEPVGPDLWASIEQSLAHPAAVGEGEEKLAAVGEGQEKSDAPKPAPLKVRMWRRWSAAAAAIALLGVGGSYVYLRDAGESAEPMVQSTARESAEQPTAQGTAGASTEPMAQSSDGAAGASLQKGAPSLLSKVKNLAAALLPAEDKGLGAAARREPALLALGERRSEEASLPMQEKAASLLMKAKEKAATPVAETTEAVALTTEMGGSVASPAGQKASSGAERKPARSSLGAESARMSSTECERKPARKARWQVGLGASNVSAAGGSEGATGGYVMSDPQPGVFFGDKQYVLASAAPTMVRAPRYEEAKHHAPLSIGLQVGVEVAPRLSVTTGVVYTRVASDFRPTGASGFNVSQVLHYVGIPLGARYELVSVGGLHAYVMAGGEVDFNVKNHTENGGVREAAQRDRAQLSGKASLGAQYDVTPHVGLYLEPGARYYFDNGSDVDNTFKDKKLNFNLQMGVRINVNK